MAKTTIEAEVKLDDKGNLKKTEAAAKKTSGALDQVATSSRNTDRNIKGVAGASSSATKNFSKMAQGMGGVVVPAYAAFAAQMFALTAAFDFLKRAGDLKMLQAGQVAYASVTGIGMRTLAKDIQEATNSQINFRDASQAAAIGIAAGLSPEQLNKLGNAAAGVSIALGRDVTDSFNRLIRGVTKAEPELLDELGIILRLETAFENYGRQMNIAANDLNSFQRSQAVTNEVLRQAEDKYGRIGDALGEETANTFAQLGVIMTEMADTIALALLPAAEAIAKVFKDIPAVAAASFGLLLSGPLAAMGFSLKDLSASSRELSQDYNKSYNAMKLNTVDVTDKIKTQKAAMTDLSKTILASPDYKGKSKLLQTISATGEVTKFQQAGLKTALRSAETQLQTHATVQKGIYAGMSRDIVASYRGMLTQLGLLEDRAKAKTVSTTTFMKIQWSSLASTITGAFATIGTAVGRLFNVLGYLGIAYTLYEVIKNFIYPEKELSEKEKADKKQLSRLVRLNEEYSKSVEIQNEILKGEVNEFDLRNAQLNVIRQMRSLKLEDLLIMKKQSEEGKRIVAQNKEAAKGSNFTAFGYGALAAGAAVAGTVMALTPGGLSQVGALKAWTVSIAAATAGVTAYNMANKKTKSILSDNQRSVTENMLLYEATRERLKKMVDQVTLFRAQAEAGGASYQAIDDFMSVLLDPSSVSEDRFAEIQKQFMLLESTITGSTRAFTDAKQSVSDFYNTLFKPTALEETYGKIQKAKEGILQRLTFRDGSGTGDENDTRLTVQEKADLAFLSLHGERVAELSLRELKHKKLIRDIEHTRVANVLNIFKSSTMITNSQAELFTLQANLLDKQAEYNYMKEHEDELVDKGLIIKTKTLELLGQEIGHLEERVIIEEILHKLLESRKGDLDTIEKLQTSKSVIQNQTTIANLYDQQNKLARRLLDTEKQRSLRGIAGEMRAEEDANLFAYLNAEERQTGKRLKVEKQYLDDLKSIENDNFDRRKKLIDLEFQLQAINLRILSAQLKDSRTQPAFQQLDAAQQASVDTLISDIDTKILGQDGLLEKLKKKTVEVAESVKNNAIENQQELVSSLEHALKNLGVANQYADKIAKSLESNLSNALHGFIMGTMNAKDAFKAFASSVISDLARIASQQAAKSILGSLAGMFTMGAGGGAGGGSIVEGSDSFIDIFGDDMYRMGGYTKKGYSTGGVARGPDSGYAAVLHGNEAVVPLPDGRRIPVQLQGGGGVNNITVNVSSDGQTQTQGSSSAQAAGLGRAIALAVQKEIQQQKRSGGMLSPYGAA